MNRLLNSSEHRRIQFIEYLSQSGDWTPLSELSETLNTSIRVLKEDLSFFKKHLSDFSIESSQDGIRLTYKQNKGIKNIYQQLLEDSASYRLLEAVFLNQYTSMIELEEAMFLSASTIYRLIRQINSVFASRNIKIVTSPYKIVGDENNIRSFYYQYFYEKYSFTQWPFLAIDEKKFESFLAYLIQLTELNNDFAYFSKFKVIMAVNLTRFKQNHFVETEHIDFKVNFSDLEPFSVFFEDFERDFSIQYEEFTIKQLFTFFIQDDFSVDYERLMNKSTKDNRIAEEIAVINQLLDNLSDQHNIPIPNKAKMVSALRNIIHLDYLEPQEQSILYTHDTKFAGAIEKEFPNFYRSLYESMKELRIFLGQPLTEEGINFYIYTVFTYWEDLVSTLRQKMPVIRMVVISHRHYTHAKMMKEYFAFEFPKNFQVEIYEGIEIGPKILKELPCDIIVADFTIPEIPSKPIVYIHGFPTLQDMKTIQNIVYQMKIH